VVFVLDKHKRPLMPCSERRARLLLARGRAAVHRIQPFTIRLKDRLVEESTLQAVVLKVDPGAQVTGLALVRETVGANGAVHHALHLAELSHRGFWIQERLRKRAAQRRRRRTLNRRYRQPRFFNRRRRSGWLPPSLRSRVNNVATWARRYAGLAPIARVEIELVRFDIAQLRAHEERDQVWQRGQLARFERWEYLLEKWGRRCAYCGAAEVRLEADHIVPVARGGSDRVSNLTLACRRCNQDKGSRTAAEFGYPEVQACAGTPLRDAAAVNTTRWAIVEALRSSGFETRTWSGARTRWNRVRFALPKTHALDALCVGSIYAALPGRLGVLQIRATGRGCRQMSRTDRFGVPQAHRTRRKSAFGFQTGDLVRGILSERDGVERLVGRVTIRSVPNFTLNGRRVHPRVLTRLQRADGYDYRLQAR
jgi:5-methylcytosine-specific restriction endonuclease McrA